MTMNFTDKYGVTVSTAKSVGGGRYEASADVFLRSEMATDVHHVVGEGKHATQATNDAVAKAKAWAVANGGIPE
jgi:hypothetical protein